MTTSSPSLNPLHCGAVVASRSSKVSGGRWVNSVSIPFIAGQWSLPVRNPPAAGRGGKVSIPFIAGQWSLRSSCGSTASRPRCVSIPFIAGQWSLHIDLAVLAVEDQEVSIPFIAGQWSLPPAAELATRALGVSQSPSLRGSGRFFARLLTFLEEPTMSQSPSLRGSGRFRRARRRMRRRRLLVSIPFIAGQWSLPVGDVTVNGRVVSQSPSLRGSGRFIAWGTSRANFTSCLNPLHCGAVVASGKGGKHMELAFMSQSPSLRGSGRFRGGGPGPKQCPSCLNPLHCGAVVASHGQDKVGGQLGRGSQSPSLRGSGRFFDRPARRTAGGKSQSPSLRGSGRFWRTTRPCRACA